MGLEPVVAPLFRIVPVGWQAPDPSRFDALLLTSANAVRCGGAQLGSLRSLPVHAVGNATAAAAREAGLEIATAGDAGIDRLLATIAPGLKLLHLCGEDRRSVEGASQEITVIPVYRAEPLPPPDLLRELPGGVAAVHSPRAAARLAELTGGSARQWVRIAAISEAAVAAAGSGWESALPAEAPSDEAVLALAARLCEEDGQQ
jgi:uroporphyrinogen-III synthase